MPDYATPNLPSRDLSASFEFYAALGFTEDYRDEGWMILERGDLVLEFFLSPEVDPLSTAASCCLRLDDLDTFYQTCVLSGLAEKTTGHPRLHPPQKESWGGRVGALVDLDGNLLRLIQN